jgi:hypothetical protein
MFLACKQWTYYSFSQWTTVSSSTCSKQPQWNLKSNSQDGKAQKHSK